jgi:hypothetical protein
MDLGDARVEARKSKTATGGQPSSYETVRKCYLTTMRSELVTTTGLPALMTFAVWL